MKKKAIKKSNVFVEQYIKTRFEVALSIRFTNTQLSEMSDIVKTIYDLNSGFDSNS